jgi:hypothetical protein
MPTKQVSAYAGDPIPGWNKEIWKKEIPLLNASIHPLAPRILICQYILPNSGKPKKQITIHKSQIISNDQKHKFKTIIRMSLGNGFFLHIFYLTGSTG